MILEISDFNYSVLANECFEKALRRLSTSLPVSNSLYGKLVSSLELPTIFVDNLKVTSVKFFVAGCIILIYELITLRLRCYFEAFYTNIISNQNKFVIVSLQHSHSFL